MGRGAKLKDETRQFPGKTSDYDSIDERRLQQAALRHHMRGHKVFRYKGKLFYIDNGKAVQR